LNNIISDVTVSCWLVCNVYRAAAARWEWDGGCRRRWRTSDSHESVNQAFISMNLLLTS